MENKENAKILIAEDDELILNALSDGLELAGFNVYQARDGEKALSIIKEVQPGIVLLDITMPKKDGLEVLQELRSDEKTKNIHVLVFSNMSDKETIDAAKKLKIDKYLLKADYTVKELVQKIKEYCQGRQRISFHYHI